MKQQQIIDDLLKNGTYDKYDVEEIIDILIAADDQYENDGEDVSFTLEDDGYDVIKLNAKRLDPTHSYFTGVGADVRGDKIDLPNAMPSLEQVQIGEVAEWLSKNNLNDQNITITDKMDGTSAQIIYDKNGDLQIGYSRGNGLQGADITRHLRRMKNLPQTICSDRGSRAFRAEVELSESNFIKLQMSVKTKSGKRFKNARNMVAGLMNREEAPELFYELVDVFVYELLNNNILAKDTSLELIASNKFTPVVHITVPAAQITDDYLSTYLNERRDDLDHAIDGIVLTVDDIKLANSMDKGITGKSNPNSSVKYKVADADNFFVATCSGVTYNVSKDGYWKPQINFEPFDLCGVTISNTTGFNASYIESNMIGVGAKILMTRSGDVVPYAVKIVSGAGEWIQPEGDNVWSKNHTDLILRDPESNAEVRVQRVIDFCTSLELPMLRDGNIRKIFNAGYDTLDKIINMDESEFTIILGSNGTKAYTGLRDRLNGIPFVEFAGATPYFGRGVGERKLTQLFDNGEFEFINNVPDFDALTVEAISDVRGFQEITAAKIVDGIPAFVTFLESVSDSVNFADLVDTSQGALAEQKIVFTDFRDKMLEKQVKLNGGTMQSSVSSKTSIVVTPTPDANTGKLTKARDLADKGTAIRIMSVEAFKALIP
jgi:NAD-dependent DNA ligase